MATPEGYERRYLRRGKVAHLIRSGMDGISVCNIWAGYTATSDFWGSGSQEEYEKADSLPLCKSCLRAIGQPYRPEPMMTDEEIGKAIIKALQEQGFDVADDAPIMICRIKEPE